MNFSKTNFVFIIICFSILLFSCADKIYLKKIKTYFNASTISDKSKFMADDYHSYFIEKKGTGENKNDALKSFQNWDAPLHPEITILNCTRTKNIWTVNFNEQNDFAKLIEFPGWKGTEIITFNKKKLIEQSIYIPDSTNPSYKKWLLPAVEWLQANKPDSLKHVYQNGKLVQNEATAKEWVILKEWRRNK